MDTTMGDEMVSADEAREMLEGLTSGEYPLADGLAAEEPEWDWILSKSAGATACAASVRLLRTVIALRTELATARREGAAEFRDAVLHGPHHLLLSAYQEGRIFALPLPGDAPAEAL